jgi:hypothetical protein
MNCVIQKYMIGKLDFKTKCQRNVRPTASAHTPPRILPAIFIFAFSVITLQLFLASLSFYTYVLIT